MARQQMLVSDPLLYSVYILECSHRVISEAYRYRTTIDSLKGWSEKQDQQNFPGRVMKTMRKLLVNAP